MSNVVITVEDLKETQELSVTGGNESFNEVVTEFIKDLWDFNLDVVAVDESVDELT